MNDNPVKEEVQKFNRSSLKKTETKEKQSMPTQDGKCLREEKCAPNSLIQVPFPSLSCIANKLQLTKYTTNNQRYHPCSVKCQSVQRENITPPPAGVPLLSDLLTDGIEQTEVVSNQQKRLISAFKWKCALNSEKRNLVLNSTLVQRRSFIFPC